MQLKSIYAKRATAVLLILFNLGAGIAAICMALFLRFPKASALRDQITHALGYDGRAALEHFLVGYGLVVLGVISLSVQYFMSMRDQPKIHPDGTAVKRFRLAVVRWSAWTFSRDIRVAIIFGIIYLCCTVCWWEVKEAYFGANGLPARGYLQWDQIATDILGVAMAILHLKLLPSGIALLFQKMCSPALLPTL